MVVMARGRVTHQGTCADAATHRALEAVFDERITIQSLSGHWLALAKP
jgi:iron complex transport system ATP-binding protein